MDYTLIRSSRRTLAIQIDRSGTLIVRAPRLYPVYLIERFIESKKSWIQKHIEKAEDRKQKTEQKEYSEAEVHEMKKRLMEYLRVRVPELWEWRWLPKYTSIKITKSERRWWSCSGKNWLCFSYRLAEWLNIPPLVGEARWGISTVPPPTPPKRGREFIDAVIVHELAHLREKHHQPKFWNLVYSMMPEYESIMREKKIDW